jgi:PleD family two-component response regulator
MVADYQLSRENISGLRRIMNSALTPKVLIIDDACVSIRILNETLKSDCHVSFATTGEKGIAMAVANHPDLILLDVLMPEMDGFEVCKKLKADSRTSNIPIVFITVQCQPAAEKKGYALGAVDYISKPFKRDLVKEKIKTLLNLN